MKRKRKRILNEEVELANIPIPGINREKPSRFPFHKLEVGGNCMIVKGMTSKILKSYISYAQRRNNAKYIVRTLSKGVCGVWRVS